MFQHLNKINLTIVPGIREVIGELGFLLLVFLGFIKSRRGRVITLWETREKTGPARKSGGSSDATSQSAVGEFRSPKLA